jgi:phosphatidylinositol 4-kinase
MHATGHPLSRELRFNIIMLSLKVLRHGTVLSSAGLYRLKNQMLSAALSWFSFVPCFTFGGNRLQLKAEAKLLADVSAGLESVRNIGAKNPHTLKRLRDKEELLFVLLENEQSRLWVWLDPWTEAKDSQFGEPSEADLSRLVKKAWFVSTSLAISLATRFHSAKLHMDVRSLLLDDPLRAINDPEGLNILMGREYQGDLTWQLKVCILFRLFYELLIICSISCFGHQSIPSRLSRTFCLHLATTHSSSNMLCVPWKAIAWR